MRLWDWRGVFEYVRKITPRFIINAEGSSAAGDGSASEARREQIFQTNAVLPQTIGSVCDLTNTPWGHVSSAAICSGARVFENGGTHVERGLNQPRLRRLFVSDPV